MPKAKLKVSASDKGKLLNAAELADVTVKEEGIKVLGTEMIVPVQVRSNADLFVMGQYFTKVSNDVPKVVAPAKK